MEEQKSDILQITVQFSVALRNQLGVLMSDPQVYCQPSDAPPGKPRTLVMFDPDNDVYFRKTFITMKVLSIDYNKYLSDLLQDIDKRYRSWVRSKLAPNEICQVNFPNSGPGSFVAQIPGLMQFVKHPVSGTMSRLDSAIMSLNDNHGWTRERIADWLEEQDVNPILEAPDDVKEDDYTYVPS